MSRGAPCGRSSSPVTGSSWRRLSRPIDGSLASASQTASHEPVSSQRTSNSANGPSSTTDAGAPSVVTPAPSVKPRRTSAPSSGTGVMPSGPTFTVPSQVTAHVSVGSTTGRQALPSMAVSLPLAGSRKNDWAVTSPRGARGDATADEPVVGPRCEDAGVVVGDHVSPLVAHAPDVDVRPGRAVRRAGA